MTTNIPKSGWLIIITNVKYEIQTFDVSNKGEFTDESRGHWRIV